MVVIMPIHSVIQNKPIIIFESVIYLYIKIHK